MMKFLSFIAILVVVLLLGCGIDKTPLPTEGSGNGNVSGDTLYIQVKPTWGGFVNPQAILIGHEPFIYVCDIGNNKIFMLNTAGQILGSLNCADRGFKNPRSIAQDYKLNLLVCADFDTTIDGVAKTFSCVYKIDLHAANHVIANAPARRLLPVTDEDFKRHADRKYSGVTVFADNSFYVARSGPGTDVGKEDNAVIKFVRGKTVEDSLVGAVSQIDPFRPGLISANGINSMSAFKKGYDFIATFSGDQIFKIQWFHFYQSSLEEKYVSLFEPGSDAPDIVTPNRLISPTGCCLDESADYIFVADGGVGKDSVYKFSTKTGKEMHSFGGPSVFKNPTAVAFFDKILYVLDAGDNTTPAAILRFKLSTDL